MTDSVETVTINGLRYVVAVLKEGEAERIAQRVVALLRRDEKDQRDRELDAEHRRQADGFRHDP